MLHVAKLLAKRLFFEVASSPPAIAHKLRRLRKNGRLTILNFHRVGPDDGSTYAPLSPAVFEDTIRFCQQNFAILTFGELADFATKSGKPPAIISFDDGYQDFAEFAAPILNRHGVRCNINLIPACLETGLPPLNVQAQDFIGQASASALSSLEVPGFALAAGKERGELGRRLSNFIKQKPIAEQKTLARILRPQFEAERRFAPAPMMSVETARKVCEPYEIGAHSFEHATLSCESDDYVRKDAEECAAYFRENFGRATDIYAVPNGGFRANFRHILEEAGFRHILLTGDDYSQADSHLHPRFGMYGENSAELRYRATGFVRH